MLDLRFIMKHIVGRFHGGPRIAFAVTDLLLDG
jgi:hypothetical protein